MKKRDDLGGKPGRRPRPSPANRRAKAKAALTRQRIRAAAGMMRAFRTLKSTGRRLKSTGGKLKSAGGSVKAASARLKSARKAKCPACGARRTAGAKFCAACGADVTAPAPAAPPPAAAVKKPMLWRRGAAQLIDRLLPLPFLVLLYPRWWWVAGGFQLLCEMWSGRGPGKWICRMRTVDARSLKPCGPVRGLLRRLGVALGQAAYCRWEWVPFAVAYDLLSFLFVWRDRDGRRIEDHLLRTRVIGEGRYRKLKRLCDGCGAAVPSRARFCSQCGKKP